MSAGHTHLPGESTQTALPKAPPQGVRRRPLSAGSFRRRMRSAVEDALTGKTEKRRGQARRHASHPLDPHSPSPKMRHPRPATRPTRRRGNRAALRLAGGAVGSQAAGTPRRQAAANILLGVHGDGFKSRRVGRLPAALGKGSGVGRGRGGGVAGGSESSSGGRSPPCGPRALAAAAGGTARPPPRQKGLLCSGTRGGWEGMTGAGGRGAGGVGEGDGCGGGKGRG